MIFSKIRLVLALILALGIAGGVAYHFWSINKLNKKIADITEELTFAKVDLSTAKANQETLKNIIEEQKQSIIILQQQRKIDQAKINTLAKHYDESKKQVGDLRKKLSKHDIGYLMLQKPGLVEDRMNNATEKFGDTIEEITTK